MSPAPSPGGDWRHLRAPRQPSPGVSQRLAAYGQGLGLRQSVERWPQGAPWPAGHAPAAARELPQGFCLLCACAGGPQRCALTCRPARGAPMAAPRRFHEQWPEPGGGRGVGPAKRALLLRKRNDFPTFRTTPSTLLNSVRLEPACSSGGDLNIL